MSLQILTTVWGEKHLEIFRRGTLRSLSFKRNKARLFQENAVWNVCTDAKDIPYLEKQFFIHFPELEVVFKPTEELRDYTDTVQSAMLWIMKKCLETGDKLLLAPPDTIFADGAVDGLLAAGREKGTCVAAAHPRVLPEILSEELSYSIPATEMVNLAWKYLHKSWTDAEWGHPYYNGYVGGVQWSKVHDKVMSVIHRLPTVYLADFTDEDLKYFKSVISFGHFDHMWPGDILIPRGRQRYVASSDLAFMVEITEKNKNVPPIIPNAPLEGFWRSHAHNEINKGIVVTYRGA